MIGIFGGTFDPVHLGHLRTAADVRYALKLEQISLIPLRSPPHRDPPVASNAQRLEMLQAAVASDPDFVVDDRELKREGKSYTLDTLHSLKRELKDKTLCLLIGSDAFSHFPRWRQPDEILQLAHLVIMQRPGDPIADHYRDRQVHDPRALQRSDAGCIMVQPVTQLEISSTQVRNMLDQGQSPRYLVPDPVLNIINQEQIYN